MENKKGISLFIYFITGILLLIIVVSAYKAHQMHQERLYRVVHAEIKETARICYLMGDCEGPITLSVLYELTDLERIIDPVTKEYMNEDLCIDFIDNEVILC